jgi:SAM-dependent methyltransferase
VRRTLPLSSRADLDELLDGGRLSASEVAANLRDLARLNRLPGGSAASVRAGERLTASRRPSVIDVGTGLADIARAFARRSWSVTAVDLNVDVLAQARSQPGADVTLIEADARQLPFSDQSFDVAHSSLLIHHLDPSDAVDVLREMARVARDGVIINDLRRGLLPLAATALSVAALGRSRVTRADGITSVRRAYTIGELDELITAAGLRVTWRSGRWMPRIVTAATWSAG